jgi:hypothetical protein
MNIDYSCFREGYYPSDWNRLSRFPFSSALKVDYASKALPVSRTPAAIVEERETNKTPVRAKTFHRIWSLVRHGPELIAGLLTVSYVILALALGGALLFFTFAH